MKIYNENSENKEIAVISFFDGVKEDRLRMLGLKTFSISCIGGWNVFNKIERYEKQVSNIIKEEPCFKVFILVGICKLANLALGVSNIIASKFTDKKILCIGAPFCFDCDKGVSPSCNGVLLSPALRSAWRKEQNRKNLSIYGDACNIPVDINILKVIQFIPYSDLWDLDIKNKEKLSNIVSFTYEKYVENHNSNEKTHAFFIDFLKNEEEKEIFLKKILDLVYESS